MSEPTPPNTSAVEAATAAPAFPKKKNRGNIRKRPNEDEGQAVDAQEDDSAVVRKAKTVRGDPLAFSNKVEGADEVHVTWESSKALQTGKDETVFKMLETETATDRDAR